MSVWAFQMKFVTPQARPRMIQHLTSIKVTVNIGTCTYVFTVITTKDQSGGIYNSYGGQGIYGCQVNKPHPWAIVQEKGRLE